VGGAWSVGGWGGTKQEQNPGEQNENIFGPAAARGCDILSHGILSHLDLPFKIKVFYPVDNFKTVVKIQQTFLIMTLFPPYLEHNYKVVINNGRFKVSLKPSLNQVKQRFNDVK